MQRVGAVERERDLRAALGHRDEPPMRLRARSVLDPLAVLLPRATIAA
jgi:hypothetical protein